MTQLQLSVFSKARHSESTNVYDPSKPLFTSPETGDYTLAKNSQAIDIGNNTYVTVETDLFGNPRIVNGIVDLGAYEYQASQPEPLSTPSILTGKNGHYVSYGANRHQIEWSPVENAAGYELSYTTDSKTWTSITAAPTASSTIITGLTYGAAVTYKLRAIAENPADSSDWTVPITFDLCPMDINNDGDIANADRILLADSWLTEEGDELFNPAADIDGNGEVSNTDRNFLSTNWLKESTDDDLVYPRALAGPVADAVFTTPDIF